MSPCGSAILDIPRGNGRDRPTGAVSSVSGIDTLRQRVVLLWWPLVQEKHYVSMPDVARAFIEISGITVGNSLSIPPIKTYRNVVD